MLSLAAIFLGVVALAQGESYGPNVVAFTAALTEETTISRGQGVIYNNTIINIGNGYDTTTGIFTAPLDGLYGLHIHLHTRWNSEAWLALLHNEENVVTAHGYGSVSAGNFALLTLKAGDRVQVKAININSYVSGAADNRGSTFSGYLIASTSD
ncbi:hypothetical protein BsWGS_22705 [Bradybaena similaris]